MSGSGQWSALRRFFRANALPHGDVQGLQACKGHYDSTGCENHRPQGFGLTSDNRSQAPLTDADLAPPGEAAFHGFLRREAREIEQHLRNLQGLPGALEHHRNGPMMRDLTLMQVAQEFRCWAWLHSNSMVLWEKPDDDRKSSLERRKDLIWKIINDRQQMNKMVGFPQLVDKLTKVDAVLDKILERWDVYNAQERFSSQLKSACRVFDDTVFNLIEYSVFAFLGIDAGQTFEPKSFIEAQDGDSKFETGLTRLARTRFGRMLKKVVEDPQLSAVLTSDSRMPVLQNVGGPIIPKLIQEALGWKKPVAAAEFFVSGHGLVEASVCQLGLDDYHEVLEHILKLWEAARAAASTRHLLCQAAEMAHLGGELLLSRPTSKKWAEALLRFAFESVAAAEKHFEALQKLDKKGSVRISREGQKGGHQKNAIWEHNRKLAEHAGVKVKKNIKDIKKELTGMKDSVSKVTLPEILHEFTQRATLLGTSSRAVFQGFNGWENFRLNEAELTFFRSAQLEESTAPRLFELPSSTDGGSNRTPLQDESGREEEDRNNRPFSCNSSGLSRRSDSSSWTSAGCGKRRRTQETAQAVRVTLRVVSAKDLEDRLRMLKVFGDIEHYHHDPGAAVLRCRYVRSRDAADAVRNLAGAQWD